MTRTELPQAQRVLAVVAHPDDETFGLGAILAAFVDAGSEVSVLCFTHGEASTLGASEAELAKLREEEFRAAAEALGIARVTILDYPDGALSEVPLAELISHIEQHSTDLVLVFDEGGITGHPDHERATEAALATDPEVPVLAWALSAEVAQTLCDEFDAGFVGRNKAAIDIELSVDRTRQLQAIECHQSQAHENPVLWRRLELQHNQECLRYLSQSR